MSQKRGPAGRTERVETAARIAVSVTAVLTVLKVAVWALTSSLAVLSQALDSALDLIALGLVFVAVRIARRPADTSHHYGHAKAENLVAFTQTLFLGLVAAGVAAAAIGRLAAGNESVQAPWYALGLLGASIVIDAVRARWLYAAARSEQSDALLAGAINVGADVGTATLALVSLVLVRLGLGYADAVGGFVVAGVVAFAAFQVGRRSVDVLMDHAPASQVAAIEAAASSAPGVGETRRVRVRSAGDQLFADVTVAAGRTASLERAHDIAEAVESQIAEAVPGTDVVVHVEPITETSGLVERARAAATRVEGIHEVHNVQIHAFEERGLPKLHATLHAKVRADTSLEEAHRLSDDIEDSVARELGENVRVDTHIEPLPTTTSGRDVTSMRDDVVEAFRRRALEEEDILDCHEIIVTAVSGGLSVLAHVRGRGSLPLQRIHAASERIETAVRRDQPDVTSVTVHFEPA